MTKSDFNAAYDECYSSFLRRTLETDLIANRMEELLRDKNPASNGDLVSSVFTLSLELNASFLRSVLQEVLEFDD